MDNLKIWEAVSKTDPSYTKSADVKGYKHTAINGCYQSMRATAIFGPCGTGWGWKMLEERLDNGQPMVTIIEGHPPIIQYEQVHTLRIMFWYVIDGVRGEIEDVFGHTVSLYKANSGKIIHDGEAPKKSISDAIKKALSFLGFSADIHMGMFDDHSYVAAVKTEAEIEKAADRDAEVQLKRDELTKYVTDHAATIAGALSVHEVSGIEKVVLRNLERQMAIPDLADIAKAGITKIARDAGAKKESLKTGEKK